MSGALGAALIDHSELEFSPIRDDEAPALEALMAQALVIGQPWMAFWMRATGYANYRVVRYRGRVAAGLSLFHTAQYLGGRAVPTVGINGVGVAPEYRGLGVGKFLMRRALEELHGAGAPLSILYPSTLAFYRAVGYERAGTRIAYELPLTAIPFADRTLDIVPVDPSAYDQLKQIYLIHAQHTHGHLDRANFIWERILHPPDTTAHAYFVARDAAPVGYVIFTQANRTDPLRVLDFCALDQAAGQRLLTFLGDHRTMIETMIWNGTPADTILSLLPEQRGAVTTMYDWLLRIVDVGAALAARGYSTGFEAELHVDLADDLLPDNAGRWIVRIVDGRAAVERGGDGRIKLGVRELAALYTSHFTPVEIQHIGAIVGSAADLGLLGLALAGPRPRMSDMF